MGDFAWSRVINGEEMVLENSWYIPQKTVTEPWCTYACFWCDFFPCSQLFQANQSVFGSSQGSSTEDLFTDSIDSCDLDITEKVQTLILVSTITPSLCWLLWGFCSFPKRITECLSFFQVSYLEKKVTELESDSLANSDLKSKLKQENTHLVHRQEKIVHLHELVFMINIPEYLRHII